ncbi:hypothetical protein C8R45DRAFT_981090 [Mycena sanguinolenta]|nr:hypothetical protein C8R45DRAFT_981090 [Mycena sanguinolenta]
MNWPEATLSKSLAAYMSSNTTNPTFVLVPGVAHGSAHFGGLVAALNAKSYPTEVISNPSVGPLAGTALPNADTANLRRVLEELVNAQQKEVVLVCHSYGGMVGCQSIHGLERSAARQGGILKVVFLSAIMPREGEAMVHTFGAIEFVPPQWMVVDVSRRSTLLRESFADAESKSGH